MKVVAFVASSCIGRMETCLANTHSLRGVASLEALRCALDAGLSDVGLIDLDVCREADMRLLTLIVSRHGPRVVAYATFAQPNVRAILSLARHGLRHVAYRGIDDLPTTVKQTLFEAAASGMSAQILGRLSPLLCGASAGVRNAVAELFSDPLRFRCAADVADVAGITRRSLDRSLHALGLEPTRTFLLAARLTWVYPRMRMAGVRVRDVSQQLGVSKPERLARHTHMLLGLAPSMIRAQLTPDQFVETIAARLRRQPRAVQAQEHIQDRAPVSAPAMSWAAEGIAVAR